MYTRSLSRFVGSYSASALLIASAVCSNPLVADTVGVTGSISVDRTTVLAESIVNVDWSANYPTEVTDIINVPDGPTQTVTPRVEVRVDVRVIGAAFGPGDAPYPVQGFVKSTSSGTWTRIFLGNQNTYNPQSVVWSKVLNVGETLDFKFQGSYDKSYNLSNPSSIKSWKTAIDTTSSSLFSWNRKVLKNGDIAPNYIPAFDQTDLKAHLSAYFKPGTSRVTIGPRDLIYLTELSPFSLGDAETDMQDLVLLVTFTEI